LTRYLDAAEELPRHTLAGPRGYRDGWSQRDDEDAERRKNGEYAE
jgi:hypothetical protein